MVYVYIYISKHTRLSLYNVTCMDVFRLYYFVLESQLVCFSWEKTISPAFSIP